jgi:hypothetical protein
MHGPRGIRDNFGSSRKHGWQGKPMLMLTLCGYPAALACVDPQTITPRVRDSAPSLPRQR